jgi:hypothetical protein
MVLVALQLIAKTFRSQPSAGTGGDLDAAPESRLNHLD